MKKNASFYLISWAVVLAVFNVIAFVVPAFPVNDKYGTSFWLGYSLITVALLCQLACAMICSSEANAGKRFYGFSILAASYAGLFASFIAGGICMAVSFIPDWVGAIICAVILGANIISMLSASAAVDAIAGVDNKIKVQTFFVKSLTVDANTLVAKAQDESAKAECVRVYEAIRYSDPMSNDALTSVEAQISLKFAAFSDAVNENDAARMSATADELIILIGDRNKKCMLLK